MEEALFKNSALSPLIFSITLKYLSAYRLYSTPDTALDSSGEPIYVYSELTSFYVNYLVMYFTDINNDPFLNSCQIVNEYSFHFCNLSS